MPTSSDIGLNPLHVTPYATKIPSRNPEVKVHKTLGHAKSAITNQIWGGHGAFYDMVLYEFADGEWASIYEVPKGTKKENLPWR